MHLRKRGLRNMSKKVPAMVVACAAVVAVGGPGFCRGATCRVRSGSMSLFECHNIYTSTKLGELELLVEEGPLTEGGASSLSPSGANRCAEQSPTHAVRM